MRKVYYLPHCSTCKKALAEIGITADDFDLQNTKEKHISGDELDMLKEKVGSYEVLFNRRSMKYRSMSLKDKEISEVEYRELILGEYTFLKRPTIVIDGEVFLATSKKAVQAAKEKLG
ncbi:MAG: arsenate reductase [Maribacter sp.]|jgi:arsenate reductase